MITLEQYLNNCSDKVLQQVADISMIMANVKWKTVSFTIPMEPVPSHRPRLCGYRVYVPGAAKNAAYFNKKVLPTLGDLYITTPFEVHAKMYVHTPKSFSKVQTALAEMGILRPWGNIGDVDNFAKSLYDQMTTNEKRGHRGIFSNDCLIINSTTSKYYSMNPRTEVIIKYMEDIPSELYKILRLKGDDCIDEFIK